MAIRRTVQQQYENYIAVKKGVLESQRLSFTATLDDSATGVVRGSLVSINATSGKFVLGLPEPSDSNTNVYPMPMFSKKNAYDPDVTTGAVGASTDEILATSIVGQTISAYAATGAFELETSEFDTTANYSFGTALVGQVDSNSKQTGKVTPAANKGIYGSKTVVGIVSRKPFRSQASMNVNGTGNNRLCFWTVFFPPKRG